MGERFGNYELLEKIAVGGMAEIFLARSVHSQGIEKRMVIKRIHPTLSNDKSFVAMFIDEARLGVGMVHGNIVPVFDFGYVDGYYFLAMEYVLGQNLAELHARAYLVDMPWPVELAIYTTIEILEGLDYAHKKRDDQGRPLELVHRDVSPSNILISNDGQVKLLDFGIARSLAREYETRTGVIKGKPGYMSPEQAAGKSVDARADVWSSGSVLYELYQGHKLKDGRQSCDDPELEEILDRSLAGNRDNRYRSAREFQTALADYLAAHQLRPTSSDLSDFIRKVVATEAPGENWDLHSESMEQHVAEALAKEIGAVATKTEIPSRTSLSPQVLETDSPTKRLSTAPEKHKKKVVPALFGMAALGLILVFFLVITRNTRVPDQIDNPTGAANAAAGPSNPLTTHQTAPEISPSKVALPVTSDPPGANVHLDGKDTGQATPTTRELPPVKASLTPPVTAAVTPIPKAFTVQTEPPGATITIDGVNRGKSPLTLTDLPPGKHRIVSRLKGRQSVQRTVEIQTARDQKLSLTLPLPRHARVVKEISKTGFLSVNSVPWTNVTLDGKMIGTTPIINREIPAGKHTILLTNPVRNLSKRVDIDLTPGEKRRIREILKHTSGSR